MKTYSIYIKSHCELPDYEEEIEAESPGALIRDFEDLHGYTLTEYDFEELSKPIPDTEPRKVL